MISEKIRPHHLQRKALLYVRQSSAHQVLHNRESSALQYAMRDRLVALGWSQIEVIDDDLGRSAAGGTQRSGFERMVAEVCLGKVGAVCAREVSRFARNSRDWQQLIEMCRVVDTVLIDQETVYAPRHGNDRLLLGLKGSLNEYELDLLRWRSLAARYEGAPWRARGHVASRRLCSDGKPRGDDSMAFYELRQYFVRLGKMDEWVKIMEEEIIPFQVSKGMVICGSFRGEADDSAYIWIRR